MSEAKFSSILKTERERLGLSLEQATAATRVRTQILAIFEEGDFENMPPRGYAQNMIGSYARWLGLDARKVVEVYLHELDIYEKERTFDDDPYHYHGSRNVQPVNLSTTREGAGNTRPKRYQRQNEPRNTSHNRYETYGADDYSVRQRAGAMKRAQTKRIGDIPARNGRSSRSSRIFTGTDYSRGGASDSKLKILIIVVAIILIIVLAIILASYVSSCNNSNVASETPVANTTQTVETSGSSDSTTQTGTTTTSTAITEPFTISFTVADGTTTDAYVLVDGMEAYSGTVIGPVTQSYDVTTAVEMTFSAPGNVTVSRGDTAVDVTQQEDGSGKVSLAVTTVS